MRNTVYIVDDDEGHSELIQSNLVDGGLTQEIRRFSNGFDVIEALARPDSEGDLPLLILLDLNMPGMHGTQVLERLRGEQRTRALPVIVFSTSNDPQEIEQCYALGCNLYLKKPVTYEEFVSVIELLGQLVRWACFPSKNRSNESLPDCGWKQC